MTVAHTKKKTKYTYAERVVGALSQIQREQKKRSVHLATLRAQVRRNAETRNDALGPQWSNWMTKAVHKLESQGILEVPEPGHVAFTTDAKRTITAARRELPDSPTTPCFTIMQEDRVIKSVTQLSASRGIKRRRRSSLWVAPLDLGEEDDDDIPDTPTKISFRRRSLPNKRARRQSYHTSSKWTKAELLERYKCLEAARAADMGSLDELARLRDELATVRRSLEEAHLEREKDAEMESVARCRTPARPLIGKARSRPPLMETPTSSPLRPNTANVMGRRSMQGVIRTESGSLIDHYSKQPTPAPSTPGSAGVEDPFDYIGRDQVMHDGDGVFSAPHVLATPTATPFIERLTLPLSPGDSGSREEIFSLHGATDTRQPELRALRQTHDRLVTERTELKELLSSRDTDIQSLRAELEERTDAVHVLQADLAAANTVNSALLVEENNMYEVLRSESSKPEFDIRMKRSMLSSLLAEKEELENRVADLDGTIASLKASYDSQIMKLSQEKNALHEKLVATSETEKSLQTALQTGSAKFLALDIRFHDLNARYITMEQLLNTTSSQVNKMKEQLATAQHDQLKTSEERTRAVSHSTDVERKLSEAQIAMDTLQQDIKAANKAVNEKEAMLVRQTLSLHELENREHTLKSEGTSLNATIATLQTQIAEKNTIIESLRDDLHATTERLRSLEAVFAEKDTAITQLQGARHAAEEQVMMLTAQLRAMTVKHTELELSLVKVQHHLDQQTSELNDLQSRLVAREQACDALESDLASVTSTNDTLMSQLHTKVAEIASLHADLAKVKDAERELQSKTDLLQREKAAQEEAFLTKLTCAEDSVNTSEAEIRDLRSALQAVKNTKMNLESALHQREAELTVSQSALLHERGRAEDLQDQLREAVSRAENAENEADELCGAKLEDERNISALKEAFEHLRRLQLENLAQAEQKITSASSSPMPNRRRSSIMPGKHELPLPGVRV